MIPAHKRALLVLGLSKPDQDDGDEPEAKPTGSVGYKGTKDARKALKEHLGDMFDELHNADKEAFIKAGLEFADCLREEDEEQDQEDEEEEPEGDDGYEEGE